MSVPQTTRQIWAAPIVLSIVSVIGLVSALRSRAAGRILAVDSGEIEIAVEECSIHRAKSPQRDDRNNLY